MSASCLNMNENNKCVYQRANATLERLQPELHGVSNGVAFKSQELPKLHKHGRRTVLMDELAVVVVSQFRVIIFREVFGLGGMLGFGRF